VIEHAIKTTVAYFRYRTGLRLAPVWELDDVRQSAVVHFLETGNHSATARATYAEFRRNRRYLLRHSLGLPNEIQASTSRSEPIPDRYFARCSDRERAALCLAYECDLSGSEIAEQINTTRKAANLLLLRGRKKIRGTVESQNETEADV